MGDKKHTKKGRKGMDYDPKAGKAAFDELHPRLKAIPKGEIVLANADVPQAAIAVLRVHAASSAPAERARFAAMPDFDIKHLDDLGKLAWAAWYVRTVTLSAAATNTDVKIPIELLDAESARKERMLKVLEYHLDDHPKVSRIVVSIRSGTGYRDLAQDLTRLAELYADHKLVIEKDVKLYQSGDMAGARKGAEAILGALAADRAGDERTWIDLQNRAWTLLLASYNEVAAAGAWIHRKADDVDERFPSLYAIGRAGSGRPRKSADEPAAPVAGAPA